MKYIVLLAIFSGLIFLTFSAEAQQRRWNPKHRFKAAVLLGANLSQMDGDHFTGYDKLGVQVGVRGTALLARHLELNVELLFNQKGARVEADPKRNFSKKNRILELNYAEVPILLRYVVKEEGKGTFLEGGFSFARLINSGIEEDTTQLRHTFTEIQEGFKSNEINFVAGVGQQLTKNIGIGMRGTLGLSYVIDRREEFNDVKTLGSYYQPGYGTEIQFLRNYFLTFYANYIF